MISFKAEDHIGEIVIDRPDAGNAVTAEMARQFAAAVQDAAAKSYDRTAATAEETYFIDNQAYAGTQAALVGVEASLNDTSTQLPQNTQAESVSGASCSTAIRASKPRPATEMAKEFCHWSPQASTHL